MDSGVDGSAFFSDQARGWFWYEQPLPPAPVPPSMAAESVDKPIDRPVDGPLSGEDPRLALERLRERLQISLARALLEPTPEHLRDYLRVNQQELRRAGAFAGAWQRLLWSEPDLDYRLRAPVSDAAVAARNQARAATTDQALAALARHQALWFFFRADCPVCHRFAPVLRRFAVRHGFRVLAVSLDGGALSAFPRALPDQGAAGRLGVQAVPALFLVEPRARRARAVGYGYLSATELARRLLSMGDAPIPRTGAAAARPLPRPRTALFLTGAPTGAPTEAGPCGAGPCAGASG